MKKYILLGMLSLLLAGQGFCQSASNQQDVAAVSNLPTGMNFEALVYEEGKAIGAKDVKLRITLQDENGKVYYKEEHSTKTSENGLVHAEVGAGKAMEGKYSSVDWIKGILMAAEVDCGNGYKSMGPATKLQAVPYALYASAVPVIRGTKAGKEAGLPIFQVQNSKGIPIFSVYEEGMRINTPENIGRRPRGGFAVRSYKLDGAGKVNYNDRLSMVDGRLDLYVDPYLRRPRGGFAVMTRRSFQLRGEPKKTDNPDVLWQMNDRTTYFTLMADASSLNSYFQLRDRCNNNKVVMNVTGEGKIHTPAPDETLKELPKSTSESSPLDLEWYWPGTSPESAAGSITGFPLQVTNLRRWFALYALTEVQVAGGTSQRQTVDYEIEIQNDPNETRKLTNYLKVGLYKTKLLTGKTLICQGVMLANNLKLEEGFKFPKGKIIVRSTSLLPKNKEATLSITSGAYEYHVAQDKLELIVNKANALFRLSDLEAEQMLEIETKVPPLITEHASLYEILNNLNLNVEIEGEWANIIQAEIREGKLWLKVVDGEAFKKEVGTVTSAGKQISINMKLHFPNEIYETLSLSTDLLVVKQ